MSLTLDNNQCEFGYEMIMMVPYAHYLYQNNIECKIITCKDMKPFYFFLPDSQIELKYPSRRNDRQPINTHIKELHLPELDLTNFSPPNYSEFYKNQKIDLLETFVAKPFICVFNKFSPEWYGPPVNFIDLQSLDALFCLLRKQNINVAYFRPHSKSICEDQYQQTIESFGDYALISEYENVLNIPQFVMENNLSYNEVQLYLLAHSQRRVSVQGGSSILASFFPGENYILAKRGKELEVGSYNWYHHLSHDIYVSHTNNMNELLGVLA